MIDECCSTAILESEDTWKEEEEEESRDLYFYKVFKVYAQLWKFQQFVGIYSIQLGQPKSLQFQQQRSPLFPKGKFLFSFLHSESSKSSSISFDFCNFDSTTWTCFVLSATLPIFHQNHISNSSNFEHDDMPGEASTHDQDVFSFYEDEQHSNGFKEVLTCSCCFL
ncbi:hypothetical protein DVH24_010341 [Malus domestica]|uniref:Uncharacterized protein n=1 Tax=Malus domestica TaxID=3750 RepID=A0A498JSJ4_MALDO|nr:hypothetical protein DVH24_010341 [Malus domestica]